MAERPPFVDAHVHLWELTRLPYPWLTPPFADDGPNGSVETIARDYTLDDYLADAGDWNVVGVVHVDAGAHADAALDETAWLQGVADRKRHPDAIVAFAALDDPDVDSVLAVQAAHSNVRGIRQIINWHTDAKRSYTAQNLIDVPGWQAGYGQLAKHGLSFDLQCYPHQMMSFARLAAQHPEVPVAINHLGMPVLSDPEGLAYWRDGMSALAGLSHVSVKLSGLGFIDRYWTVDTVRPFILETIDLFGPGRVMFASDFPTDSLFAPFDRCLGALDSATAALSESERAAMFGRNAARFYRLDLAGRLA